MTPRIVRSATQHKQGGDPLAPGPPLVGVGWLRGTLRRDTESKLPASLLVLCLVAGSVALGTWGFSVLPVHPGLSAVQSLYHGLKLFTFELTAVDQGRELGPNWQIVLGALLAVAVVIRGIFALTRERLRRTAIAQLLRGHVIVCGGGMHAARLVEQLSPRTDVVMIDSEAGAIGTNAPPRKHEWPLKGDPVLAGTLLDAGAERAHWIIAITGDDYLNSQLVSTVRKLAHERKVRDRVQVLVQVEDSSLTRFLEEDPQVLDEGTVPGRTARLIVTPFSVNTLAAETVLDEAAAATGDQGRQLNLLLAGDHQLLDAVLLAGLRRQRELHLREAEAHHSPKLPVLHLSLLGPDALSRMERLKRDLSWESELLTVEARDTDQSPHARAETEAWLRQANRAEHAIVACRSELHGIRMTLEVARALGDLSRVTRVTAGSESALDRHLEDRTAISDRLASTQVRSISELALDTDTLERVAGPRRLAEALAPTLGEKAEPTSSQLFARSELQLHSDRAWRVREPELPLLSALLEPVPVSALFRAGLAVELSSPANLRLAAERLSRNGDEFHAFAAWAEYARALRPGRDDEVLAGLDRQPTDWTASEILRLRELTVGRGEPSGTPPAGRLAGVKAVAIFAGGAGSMSAVTEREISPLLMRALQRFDGIVLSGGTNVGLPGLIGTAAASLNLALIGYVPTGRGDPNLYSELRETAGATDFSVKEPVAMWSDILGAGIAVENVSLVAFPGGRITTCEVLLARALGARVAWIDPTQQSGATLDDSLALGAEDVIEPPFDPMTLRALIVRSRVDDELREQLARRFHNEYRRLHRHRKGAGDPSLAPWGELVPWLAQSNLEQADDIPNKLALIGKRLDRAGEPLELTNEQVELLAEAEHGRWNIERLLAGWQPGRRQVLRSVSPYLKPWSALDEEAREYDREAVRSIGPALREAGWGVARA